MKRAFVDMVRFASANTSMARSITFRAPLLAATIPSRASINTSCFYRSHQMMLQKNIVTGWVPGFICTRASIAPKFLNGGWALTITCAATSQSRLCRVGTDNHGQHFRRPPQRQRGEPLPVSLTETIDQQDNRHHDRHKAYRQPARAGDSAIEAVWVRVPAMDFLTEPGRYGPSRKTTTARSPLVTWFPSDGYCPNLATFIFVQAIARCLYLPHQPITSYFSRVMIHH